MRRSLGHRRATLLVLALSVLTVPRSIAQSAGPPQQPPVPLPTNPLPPADTYSGPSPAMQALAEPGEPKKYPTFEVHGALQADAGWFNQNPQVKAVVGDVQNGAAFRRVRLGANGSVTENVDYIIQMDFGFFGRPSFTDVNFTVKDVPVLGNVRVGQWKQFFGLEEVTSYRFNPFLERASIFLLQPFRRIGAGFFNHSADERFTWAASAIGSQQQDQYGSDIADGGAGLTARGTWNPIYSTDDSTLFGPKVLHLGAAYHLNGPPNGRMRIGAVGGNAPEFGLLAGQVGAASFTSPPNTPSFVDTGVLAASLYNLWGVEAAGVLGPLSVQAEANFAEVSRFANTPLYFWGGYVYTTLFLTGEHRPYNRQLGVFDRVIPKRNFNPRANCSLIGGAWEVAYRLSYIGVSDQNVDGGRLLDHTFGLNWYLNPYTKLMFNYIHAALWRGPSVGGPSNVFAVRAQLDF